MILVTGGCGFIGSNFIRHWMARKAGPVVNLDALTYSANPANLKSLEGDPKYAFVKGDVTESERVRAVLSEYRPSAVVHFAAESHVDQSITGPEAFVLTNVVGTYRLLEESRRYFNGLKGSEKSAFRFLHVSTDEVYGSLDWSAPAFTEGSVYAPNSPYSASKAGSDHLVRAYAKTYGLPTLITHCSNNFGPYQFPEKLIPLMITRALQERKLPVYGNGQNVRDWLYVIDHCEALERVLENGVPGEVYNIGGGTEMRNLDLVNHICHSLDEVAPRKNGSYEDLISFVTDRPGHDLRYAIDSTKMKHQLGWSARFEFAQAIQSTIKWYVENPGWLKSIADRNPV